MGHSILYDLTATQPELGAKRHGGGIYGEIILRRIIERGLPVEVYYDSRLWLNPEIRKLLDDNNIRIHDISRHTLPEIVEQSGCDRVYTCGERPLFRALQHPGKYYTLHGMRELETPLDLNYFRYPHTLKNGIKFRLKRLLYSYYCNKHKNRVRRMVKSGTHFVVVSNHTATSIRAYMPEFSQLEIPVFYSPSTIRFNTTGRERNDRYFLMVSGHRWEKNNLRAMIALDRLFDTPALKDYKAVITGASSTRQFKYKFKNPDKFEFAGYVDDEQLDRLYHDAYALIYPSLNEGFGYPPLEAMHYGVPVLASPFTSIPEVCGDAAIYFNPYSIEEIGARVLLILDPATRAEYSERALKRFKYITDRQNADKDGLIDFLYK